MKKRTVHSLVSLSVLILLTLPVYGNVVTGDFAIGLNYPGFGARYFFSNTSSIEGKGQFDDDISLMGLRWYYYFNKKSNVLFFAGIEGDLITFKGEDSKGSGSAAELFIGGEYFFDNNLSIQLDFGPAYISLKDKDTSLTETGVELVVNVGINFYFGKKGNVLKK